MPIVLRSSSWVMDQIQGYPQVQMTLAQVRAGLQSSQLSPTAMVQAGPSEPWRLAGEAVAECVDFQPTRAAGGIALLVAVPLAWLAFHVLLLGTPGIVAPAIVMV